METTREQFSICRIAVVLCVQNLFLSLSALWNLKEMVVGTKSQGRKNRQK